MTMWQIYCIFALVMVKQILLAAFALLLATASAAHGYTPQTVPNVQLSDARRFTSNPDGVISDAAAARIDSMCLDLRQRGLAEVVVLVLGSVDENSIDMFAHNVLNLWGVGDKQKRNGLVISVIRDQRDIQFETGYGLEGVLPDAICKRIQTVYMAPELRVGNWDAGVVAGMRAVYNVLTQNEAELGALRESENASKPSFFGSFGRLFLGLIVLVALMILLGGRGGRRNRGGGNRGGGFDDPDGGSRSFHGPDPGALIGGILGGMLGGGFGRGGGFGGGGFGGGFGGGSSGGGGARTGF